MTKEQIYERMTVQFVTPAERTGIDFEDRDLLAMVEGLEEIGKVLALKMFEYGVRFGGKKDCSCKFDEAVL